MPADRFITKDQIKALCTAARRKGVDLDEIRAESANGSIKGLTQAQAARWLNRLNDRDDNAAPPRAKRKRRPAGTLAPVSDEQWALIRQLQSELGWTDEGLDGFLGDRCFKKTDIRMNRILSTNDGVEVIELLKNVRDRTNKRAAPTAAQTREY